MNVLDRYPTCPECGRIIDENARHKCIRQNGDRGGNHGKYAFEIREVNWGFSRAQDPPPEIQNWMEEYLQIDSFQTRIPFVHVIRDPDTLLSKRLTHYIASTFRFIFK